MPKVNKHSGFFTPIYQVLLQNLRERNGMHEIVECAISFSYFIIRFLISTFSNVKTVRITTAMTMTARLSSKNIGL